MCRETPTDPRRDSGQAAVEFAIALPLVVVLVLGVVQVVVVARDQIAVELAAREGARAGAVAASPASAAARAARDATRLEPVGVTTTVTDGVVNVTVTHISTTDVAVIGPLLPPIELRASVSMRREPP